MVNKPAGVSMATSSRSGSAEEAVRRLLAACGGGGEETSSAPRPPPRRRDERRRPPREETMRRTGRSPARSSSGRRRRPTARSSGAHPRAGPRPDRASARAGSEGRAEDARRKGREAVGHGLRDAEALPLARRPTALTRDGKDAPDPRPPLREGAPDRGRRLLRRGDALARSAGPGTRARRSSASRAPSSMPRRIVIEEMGIDASAPLPGDFEESSCFPRSRGGSPRDVTMRGGEEELLRRVNERSPIFTS